MTISEGTVLVKEQAGRTAVDSRSKKKDNRPDDDEEDRRQAPVDRGDAPDALDDIVAVALHDGVEDHDESGYAQADSEVDEAALATLLCAEIGLSSGGNGFELASDAQKSGRNTNVASDTKLGDDLRVWNQRGVGLERGERSRTSQ